MIKHGVPRIFRILLGADLFNSCISMISSGNNRRTITFANPKESHQAKQLIFSYKGWKNGLSKKVIKICQE